MNRAVRNLATLAVLALLFMPVIKAANDAKRSAPERSMTVWQARRAVVAAMSQKEFRPNTHNINVLRLITVDTCTIRFGTVRVEFDAVNMKNKTEHARIDLNTLTVLSVQCTFRGIYCRLKGERGEEPAGLTLGDHRFELFFGGSDIGFCGRTPACMNTAESLARALNRLRAYAKEAASRQREFSQKATVWRALTEKPPLPEAVREQRLLAENAVKEKKLGEALDYYEAGLELYPTWPQGYFNAALIAAEMGVYEEALEHMQAYLELVPEAADAQSVRDQMVIWRNKLKRMASTAADSPRAR
jgi:tetratricopeptide (TPR) repeat protein